MHLFEVIPLIALTHQTHTVSYQWQITHVIIYNTKQSETIVFLTGCLADWYSNDARI